VPFSRSVEKLRSISPLPFPVNVRVAIGRSAEFGAVADALKVTEPELPKEDADKDSEADDGKVKLSNTRLLDV
jgi:hypothetical protein